MGSKNGRSIALKILSNLCIISIIRNKYDYAKSLN